MDFTDVMMDLADARDVADVGNGELGKTYIVFMSHSIR
jgi:hypothetical protein